MSNSKKELVYNLEAFVLELKTNIPTISEEEIQLVKAFYNFIIENSEIKKDRIHYYGCEYDWQFISSDLATAEPSKLNLFIDEQIRKNGKEVFKNLAHYLLLFKPLGINNKNVSGYDGYSDRVFYAFIYFIISTLFTRKLIEPNSLINEQNFIGTMFSYNSSDIMPLLKLLKLSINEGIDVNHKNKNGDTILNIATLNVELWKNNGQSEYGEFYYKLVSLLNENGFDFTSLNNEGLSFVDVLEKAQNKNPIKEREICDSTHHDHSGRILFTINYLNKIISILQEKYGIENPICMTRGECSERIKVLLPKINRLEKFTGSSFDSLDLNSENTSIRDVYSLKLNTYYELLKQAKEIIKESEIVSPNENLILNIIVNGNIDMIDKKSFSFSNIVDFNIINSILGDFDNITFFNSYMSGKKEEAIELFIEALKIYISKYKLYKINRDGYGLIHTRK